jgi:hypothetical protein
MMLGLFVVTLLHAEGVGRWGEWNCPKNSSTRRNGGQLANGRPFIILVAPILVKLFLLLDFWLFAMCDLGRDDDFGEKNIA